MPRPIAFIHEGIEYKAFPEQGSYFGVGVCDAFATPNGYKRYLLLVPMTTGGTPATYQGAPDPCEVVNMHEPGDDKLLEVINAEFGTAFKQSDFPGR